MGGARPPLRQIMRFDVPEWSPTNDHEARQQGWTLLGNVIVRQRYNEHYPTLRVCVRHVCMMALGGDPLALKAVALSVSRWWAEDSLEGEPAAISEAMFDQLLECVAQVYTPVYVKRKP